VSAERSREPEPGEEFEAELRELCKAISPTPRTRFGLDS